MKFKVGTRVKLTTSGRAGEVTNIFEADIWNLYGGDEYQVKFDEGDCLTVSERILENEYDVNCCCGLKFARSGGKHSPWCYIYRPED